MCCSARRRDEEHIIRTTSAITRRPTIARSRRVVLPALAVSAIALVPTTAAHAAPAAQEAAAKPGAFTQEFKDPTAANRPKYRWWQPLAATDDDELRAEQKQMKDAGAGGAEVIAFNVDGVKKGDPRLQQWGWGTPQWEQKTRVSLQAAKANGLSYAMTISPLWPASAPGLDDVNDRRIQQQLLYAQEFVAAGTTRTGALPTNDKPAAPAGARKTTVAVLVARCAVATCNTQTTGSRVLDRSTVKDVTDQVDASGNLTWTAPSDGGTWNVIVFRQTASGQLGSPFTAPNADTFASGNGYVVDHLSSEGAQVSTDYWDRNILTPQVRALIDDLDQGAEFFEDSLELDSTQKWTWDFLKEWKARRGYDAVTALPALAGAGKLGQTTPFFDFADGVGARIRNDYRQTWSDLYVDRRLKTFRAWAHKRGMTTRAQAYGEPVDSAYASGHIDVPEGESFGFANSIERYKTSIAGAHLTGNPVTSTELGANFGAVWNTTQAGTDNNGQLNQVYKAFAAGVTQVVWHGFPYLEAPAGTGTRSVWPGFSYGGNASFSEAWGTRMPQWGDTKQLNDNLGRLQTVLRQGAPRFDVAVYWQQFATTAGTLAADNGLNRVGYTSDYLSPEYLRTPKATFENGRLFPDLAGFKALVIKDQPTMPVDVARKIRDLAVKGLPVVFVGTLPATTPGAEDASDDDARLSATLSRITALPSVRTVAAEAQLAGALQDLGVRPSAGRTAPSSAVLSVRRQRTDADFYYLFNQTTAVAKQEITLEGTGKPYALNTWTGVATPIARYERTSTGVTVPVSLAANDQTVVVLTDDAPKVLGIPNAPDVAARASTADDVVPGNADELVARASAPGTYTTTLSDGRTVSSRIDAVRPVAPLGTWKLSAQSWTRGASGKAGDTLKTTLPTVDVTANADGVLPAWSAIPSLQDVSGIGTYTTTLTLQDAWTGGFGAYLDLGRVVDTVRVTVNGREVPAVNAMDRARIDLGGYLRGGENTITIRVASTLLNAVRATPDTGAASRARADYGLIGPVRVVPYGQVGVPLKADTPAPGDGGSPKPEPSPTTPATPGAPAPATPGTPAPASPKPAVPGPVRISAASAISRSTLTRRGLLVRTSVPKAGTFRLELRRGSTTLGSVSRVLTKAGTYRIRLRLTGAGRKQLAGLRRGRSVRLTVRGSIRVDGRSRVVKRTVRVRG